jgi:5-methylcytosine-specific restriction endonuclease McrA
MDPPVHKATLQVIGMALQRLHMIDMNLVTVERFLTAAKQVTGIPEISETFEIAVIQLRDFLKSKTIYERDMMLAAADEKIYERLPPIPDGFSSRTPRRQRNTPTSLKRPVTLYPGSKAPTVSTKDEFYKSWEWRTVRMVALKEHGRACQCCGAVPGMADAAGNPVRLCVDHIKPLSKFWHLRLEPSNLQILCDECNQGKGNWDQTDFRKPAAPDEWVVDDDGVSDAILAQLTDRTTGRLQ